LATIAFVAPPSTPYPEDGSLGGHDFTPLAADDVRAAKGGPRRGTVIGVERTETAHDLALAATLLTAAKWQPYRRQHGAVGLRLSLSDLRQYRRAPRADHLLVLVLDYTCLKGWDWGGVLFPHFRWAYVERAEVCLVRVGAAGARVDTRAERIIARSVLDPRLDKALSAGPGRATPLAHGLLLALDVLRHKLQAGQGVVRVARLIVLTDGRGNVPLRLDHELRPVGSVGALGIDDAMTVACRLGQMLRVERTVIDPQPSVHEHIVERVADAMNARLIRRAFDSPAVG
jgi:magnesium chelatase subunit D